ncbi:MAG: THUMP domain-containing protein, partial [Kangiellaceae bacterium]
MKFVIKLFPEIIVKSRPVRKQFIAQLRKNLKKVLGPIVENPKLKGTWDFIELDIDEHEESLESLVLARLQSTPGIEFILKVNEHQFNSVEDICQIAVKEFSQKIDGKSFCVRVKRSGKHPFSSIEVERQSGGALLQHSEASKVQLKNPDVQVQMEIRGEQLMTVVERYEGLGGFPIGQQESCVSLISGG